MPYDRIFLLKFACHIYNLNAHYTYKYSMYNKPLLPLYYALLYIYNNVQELLISVSSEMFDIADNYWIYYMYGDIKKKIQGKYFNKKKILELKFVFTQKITDIDFCIVCKTKSGIIKWISLCDNYKLFNIGIKNNCYLNQEIHMCIINPYSLPIVQQKNYIVLIAHNDEYIKEFKKSCQHIKKLIKINDDNNCIQNINKYVAIFPSNKQSDKIPSAVFGVCDIKCLKDKIIVGTNIQDFFADADGRTGPTGPTGPINNTCGLTSYDNNINAPIMMLDILPNTGQISIKYDSTNFNNYELFITARYTDNLGSKYIHTKRIMYIASNNVIKNYILFDQSHPTDIFNTLILDLNQNISGIIDIVFDVKQDIDISRVTISYNNIIC